MPISSLSRVIINTHKVSDFIPVSSTFFSLIEIFLRYLIQPIFKPKSHHFTYINDKSHFRTIILLVPIVGNLIILIWELLYFLIKKETTAKEPQPILKAIEVLLPTASPKVATDATNVLRNPTPMAEDKRSYLKRAREYTYGCKFFDIIIDYKKAIPLLEIASNQKCYDATHILASLHLYGFGVQKNVRLALSLYNKAAHAGHLKSILTLAHYFKIGTDGIKADLNRSLLYYRRAAKKLNTHALVSIGYQYENGTTVLKKNEQKALKLYKKAWKLKEVEALYLMAEFYFNKKGGSNKTDAEVLQLFRLAASHLQMQAVSRLYSFTLEGELGIPKDHNAANALMEPVMAKTYQEIMAMIGFAGSTVKLRQKIDFILMGAQPPYSIPSAIKYLKLLVAERQANGFQFSPEIVKTYGLSTADIQQQPEALTLTVTGEINVPRKPGKPMMEDPRSLLLRARQYIHGDPLRNIAPDPAKAIAYLRIASKRKHHDATRELAHLHLNGIGTPQDIGEAFLLLYRAAHTGHLTSMKDLALFHSKGLYGVDVNHDAALRYFRRAAKQLDGNSLINVGKYYEAGLEVKKNEQRALKYYKAALKAGDRAAYFHIAQFYHEGRGANEAKDSEIIDLLTTGSKLGCPLASNMLYYLMDEGLLGLAVDPEKARVFIEPVVKNAWEKLLAMKDEPEHVVAESLFYVKDLLEKTALHGLAYSKRILAEIYEKGLLGYPIDQEKSKELLEEIRLRVGCRCYHERAKKINIEQWFNNANDLLARLQAPIDDIEFDEDML